MEAAEGTEAQAAVAEGAEAAEGETDLEVELEAAQPGAEAPGWPASSVRARVRAAADVLPFSVAAEAVAMAAQALAAVAVAGV
jgi:hypothetical protein